MQKKTLEGGQKMSVFVHSQGIKTVQAGGRGVKKWQNSVHVVVECPLTKITLFAHGGVSKTFLWYICIWQMKL